MAKSTVKFILFSFLIWRLGLFVVFFFASKLLPLQMNFLGGGAANYIANPFFWVWSNFDGQHYLNIAQNGYGFGEYTFFPLYPLLIKYIGDLFGGTLFAFSLVGNVISNLSIIVALIGFYKLARIDFPEKIARIGIIVLLLFPTSFYFAGVYTESLFLALTVWAFYFARQNKFLYASVLGLLMSLARPIGIFIFPALLIEWYVQNKPHKIELKKLPYELVLSSLGLLGYMTYLKVKLNNPLAFFSEQILVGEHRSSHIILIPQILYRYIFKVFPSLPLTYFPALFFTVLEFFSGIAYLLFTIVLFFKSRLSYAVFAFLAYLTPTFLGSFSSMPRYVLILFPVYFLLAQLSSKNKAYFLAFCMISSILLVISFSLFARGYWIS